MVWHSLAPNPVRQAGAYVFGDHHRGLGSLVRFDFIRSILVRRGPMFPWRDPAGPLEIGSQALVSVGINEPDTSHIRQSCYNRCGLDQPVGVDGYWHSMEVSSADHLDVLAIILMEVIDARMAPGL